MKNSIKFFALYAGSVLACLSSIWLIIEVMSYSGTNFLRDSGPLGFCVIVLVALQLAHLSLLATRQLVWKDFKTQDNNITANHGESSIEQHPSSQSTSIEDSLNPTIYVIKNNDLGMGIKFGGEFQSKPLYIVATNWKKFGKSGWVRSGWLFAEDAFQLKANGEHAVTFFKIHLIENNQGVIHILDAANPPHTIWLRTSSGCQKESTFSWDDKPNTERTALWAFTYSA